MKEFLFLITKERKTEFMVNKGHAVSSNLTVSFSTKYSNLILLMTVISENRRGLMKEFLVLINKEIKTEFMVNNGQACIDFKQPNSFFFQQNIAISFC